MIASEKVSNWNICLLRQNYFYHSKLVDMVLEQETGLRIVVFRCF